jgi:hypothetical protein
VLEVAGLAGKGHNGMRLVAPHDPIYPGYLALFDWNGTRKAGGTHISTVEAPRPDGDFVTLGGNEGDCFRRQVRDRKYVFGFVRLPFVQPGVTVAPNAPKETRMDTADDAQVAAVMRRLHDLDPAAFGLVQLDHTAGDHLPPVQASIHDAAERIDKELAGLEAAYRAALAR